MIDLSQQRYIAINSIKKFNQMKKKIVFVSTAMTAPYVLKKIKAFRRLGYETVLYAYNRGNDFERLENQDLGKVVDLGYLESGKGYLKKLLLHIITLKRVFKENRSKDSLFILFMFDLALINLLFYKRKIVYHISDLTYTKTKNNLFVNLFRKIDRHIVKKSYFTMVTSNGFCKYLYPEGDIYNKFVEVPNLLQEDNPYERKDAKLMSSIESLRFGFVGLSRYESPIRIAKVVGKYFPNYYFAFYGNGMPELMKEIDDLVQKFPNISSHGRFNSSTDLESIYSNIDVLICCYDITNTNVRLAEPNKLYEAMFFNKPIVVSDDTYLAERVHGLGVGFSIDATIEKRIKAFIEGLTLEKINSTIERITKQNTASLIDKGEAVVNTIVERTNLN